MSDQGSSQPPPPPPPPPGGQHGSQPPPPAPKPEAGPAGKPWWKRWWGITLIVLGVFVAIGALTGDPETDDGEPAAQDQPTEQQTAEGEPTQDPPTAEDPVTEPETTETEAEVEEEAVEEPPPAFSEPITASGSGDDIVPLAIPENSPAAVTFTHDGSQNFAVWSVDAQGNQMDLLVNTIGSYSGTRPVNFQVGQDVAELEINASGSWTLEAKPLSQIPELSASGPSGGSGDDVVVVPEGLRGSAVSLTHDGDQNFAIWAYGGSTNLLVNEIGSYEGTVRMPQGALVLDITASGDWTIEPR